MTTLSIIIPVYNEEKTILKILDKIKSVKLNNIKKEIIIINDASFDNSYEILKKNKSKYNYKLYSHYKNSGKGAAVKTGIKNSTGDIIIIQDADLEYDPNDYIDCITPILNKKYKVVYGSRLLNKNHHSGRLDFLLGGMLVTLATNILYFTWLTDEPTCYKTFDAKLLRSIKIKGNKFEWEPEVTAKILKKGIKIKEVPINYYPRKKSDGKKIRWTDGIQAILTLLKYRIINR